MKRLAQLSLTILLVAAGLCAPAKATVVDFETRSFLAAHAKWEADTSTDFAQRNARFLDLLESSETQKQQELSVELAIYSLADVSYVVRLQSIKFLAEKRIYTREISQRIQETLAYDVRPALYRFRLRSFAEVSLNRYYETANKYLEAEASQRKALPHPAQKFRLSQEEIAALSLPTEAANENSEPSFFRDWLLPKLAGASAISNGVKNVAVRAMGRLRFERAPICESAFRGAVE